MERVSTLDEDSPAAKPARVSSHPHLKAVRAAVAPTKRPCSQWNSQLAVIGARAQRRIEGEDREMLMSNAGAIRTAVATERRELGERIAALPPAALGYTIIGDAFTSLDAVERRLNDVSKMLATSI